VLSSCHTPSLVPGSPPTYRADPTSLPSFSAVYSNGFNYQASPFAPLGHLNFLLNSARWKTLLTRLHSTTPTFPPQHYGSVQLSSNFRTFSFLIQRTLGRSPLRSWITTPPSQPYGPISMIPSPPSAISTSPLVNSGPAMDPGPPNTQTPYRDTSSKSSPFYHPVPHPTLSACGKPPHLDGPAPPTAFNPHHYLHVPLISPTWNPFSVPAYFVSSPDDMPPCITSFLTLVIRLPSIHSYSSPFQPAIPAVEPPVSASRITTYWPSYTTIFPSSRFSPTAPS